MNWSEHRWHHVLIVIFPETQESEPENKIRGGGATILCASWGHRRYDRFSTRRLGRSSTQRHTLCQPQLVQSCLIQRHCPMGILKLFTFEHKKYTKGWHQKFFFIPVLTTVAVGNLYYWPDFYWGIYMFILSYCHWSNYSTYHRNCHDVTYNKSYTLYLREIQ